MQPSLPEEVEQEVVEERSVCGVCVRVRVCVRACVCACVCVHADRYRALIALRYTLGIVHISQLNFLSVLLD